MQGSGLLKLGKCILDMSESSEKSQRLKTVTWLNKYFVNMMIKYAKELETVESPLEPGMAAVLYLFDCARKTRMIDLLLQAGYIFFVLAVLSLFVCTLPIWLVLVIFLLLG